MTHAVLAPAVAAETLYRAREVLIREQYIRDVLDLSGELVVENFQSAVDDVGLPGRAHRCVVQLVLDGCLQGTVVRRGIRCLYAHVLDRAERFDFQLSLGETITQDVLGTLRCIWEKY